MTQAETIFHKQLSQYKLSKTLLVFAETLLESVKLTMEANDQRLAIECNVFVFFNCVVLTTCVSALCSAGSVEAVQ